MNEFRDVTVDEMEGMFVEMRKKVLGDKVETVVKEWRDWKLDEIAPLFKIRGLLDVEFMKLAKDD